MICFTISLIYFNPLPRKEGDTVTLPLIAYYNSISIHSLVKRETSDGRDIYVSDSNFNPLPRKEGDSNVDAIAFSFFYFNPLPRKEGDRKFR